MNKGTLKVVAIKIVSCEICGEKIKREKTFKAIVSESEVEQGKIELLKKIEKWKLTNKQKHCHVCWSIKKDFSSETKGEIMEDINYIEWLISNAEGFTLNGDQLIFPEGGIETFSEHLLTLRVWQLVWFPFLILRAADHFILSANSDTDRNNLLKMMYNVFKEQGKI